jgi:hypothetical protein
MERRRRRRRNNNNKKKIPFLSELLIVLSL